MRDDAFDIGVGPTAELSLRVSVGTLVAVMFNHPADKREMLALERTATVQNTGEGRDVVVRAKPFGGAVRLVDPELLRTLIGHFHFDSERSRQEHDFRLHILPSSWEGVREICREPLKEPGKSILDFMPDRELAEEMVDSLGISITPDQYSLTPHSVILEDTARPTKNIRASGLPTRRVHYIYRAVTDHSALVELMLHRNKPSDEDLRRAARADSRRGGRGRANATLVLPLDEVKALYRSVPFMRRGEPLRSGEQTFDGNVPAVIEGIDHPYYRRYGW